MKKTLVLILAFLLIFSLVTGCNSKEPEVVETLPAVEDKVEIILSTTTSTEDSGLLDFILPIFTEDTGIVVKTV